MSELEWNDKGWGFLAIDKACEKDYFTEYCQLDETPMGRVLTALRVGMVDRWWVSRKERIVDIGIGGGAFVGEMDCFGFDVNQKALEWLLDGGRLWDSKETEIMTFWDSLEHIPDPYHFLERVKKLVFISTPIYKGKADVLASKHYKPNEHCWYFTHEGLVRFMSDVGFELFLDNCLETDAGREGIGSYGFRRRL